MSNQRQHGHWDGLISDHRLFNSTSFVSGFSQTVLQSSRVTVPPSPLSPSSSWRDMHTSSDCGHDFTDRASPSSSFPSSSSSSSFPSSPSPSSPEKYDHTTFHQNTKNRNVPEVPKGLISAQCLYDRNDLMAELEEKMDRCPLETQEILLFYSLSLLHMLALDSYKV